MHSHWLVLLPPVLVVITVLLTRHMIFSFMTGIIAAAVIAHNGNIWPSISLAVTKLWQNSGLASLRSWHEFWSNWNILIFIFLICLGVLITILHTIGAAQAYSKVAQKKVRTKSATERASLLLSTLFFVDDYFSALTVGSVMKPLAHIYKLHPVKLAFLVTAMATPVTILSPVSSWVGEIVLQLKQVGIDGQNTKALIAEDPYYVFLNTIPFILYALLLILSTWYIIARGISYGPMALYDITPPELDALDISDTSGSIQLERTHQATIFDFVFPIIMLILGVIAGLLFTGNYTLFGGTNSFTQALKNSSVHQALFIGGCLSVLTASLLFLATKKLTIKRLYAAIIEGSKLMLPSIGMLICAWTLGSILKQDLHTGDYIAHLLGSHINLVLLPAICFIFASVISLMIGSAWATIGLMFPIVIGMLQNLLHLPLQSTLDHVPLLLPIIGATLSGCVLGTHLSILADNPIMSSASTGASHLEHVKTMAWYVLPVACATLVAYIVLGITVTYMRLYYGLILSFVMGLSAAIILLEILQYIWVKYQK